MLNIEGGSILIFFVILSILVLIDRKNIELKYVVLIKRSKKGKRFIYDFAKKHKKWLRILGNIGIVVCILAAIYGLFLQMSSAYKIFFKPEEAVQQVKLVLPSVTGVKLPSFALGVPFWYWIIGVFLVVMAHEPMHALLARVEKVRIKSFGLFLALIFPGAFVDPDEKQVKKLSMIKKLRIYAGGSFGNFILAIIVIILSIGYGFFIDSLMLDKGIAFSNTIKGTGAEEAGLKGIIIDINSIPVESTLDFEKAMKNVKPGDIIEVKTTEGEFVIKTTAHPDIPERAFVGIDNTRTFFVYAGMFEQYGKVSENVVYAAGWLFGLLEWLFIINIGVGVFNLFPLKPLDGGLMMEEIVKFFYKGKKANDIINGISLFTLLLVLVTLFGPSMLG